MGKPHHGANFLYKKSNGTLRTRSKTCSGASQFLTNSGILQLKEKLRKTSCYVENGTGKRDLSIETDNCILREYYKRKLGRYKCTVNTPDTKMIDAPICDHNSCGDSNHEKINEKTRLNIDVASLVVENLKDLLNNWIKKYLLDNDETKQKIETVLDSILHNLQRSSSSCTYTLDIKVNEKNQLRSNKSKGTKYVKPGNDSNQTVPVPGKHIKLISTLSIPRNMKRHILSTKSGCLKQASRKIRYKNVFLTVSRSSTFLLNSSSFNLLSISTRSFTKRCATYNGKEIKTSKKHEVVLLPKTSYSESMSDTIYQDKVKLNLQSNAFEIEPVQSLVKSIYADDPANITSTDKNIYNCKHDNYTMTDTDCTTKNVTSTQCHQLNWEKVKDDIMPGIVKRENKRRKKTKLKTLSHKCKRSKTNKKHLQPSKSLSKKSTGSTNPPKKPSPIEKQENLIKDIRGILKHFASYTDNNINFDVRINVFPGLRNKIHEAINNEKSNKNVLHDDNLTAVYSVISRQILPETKVSNLVTENQKCSSQSSQELQPKLISILDGAISQSKYVISKENVSEPTIINEKLKNVIIEHTNISTGDEIAKDISELRVIIRDLAITTENFVKEHLNCNKPHETEIILEEQSKELGDNITKVDVKISTESKAVQYSSDKNPITSGLKLKKIPKKKDTQEFNIKLPKKSVSYNIIESESILKVTDMTSALAEISTEMLIDKAINCSLPKSTSQFDMNVKRSERKLLTYYCDEFMKSRQFVQNHNTRCTCSSNTVKYSRCPNTDNDSCPLIIKEPNCQNDIEIVCDGPQQYVPCKYDNCEMSNPVYSCSSVYVDVEDRKKIAIRSRSGISFFEGLLYCILLWIPVFVIFWLIYVYVIKDIIQPGSSPSGSKVPPPKPSSNNSLFHIRLSDLGF